MSLTITTEIYTPDLSAASILQSIKDVNHLCTIKLSSEELFDIACDIELAKIDNRSTYIVIQKVYFKELMIGYSLEIGK